MLASKTVERLDTACSFSGMPRALTDETDRNPLVNSFVIFVSTYSARFKNKSSIGQHPAECGERSGRAADQRSLLVFEVAIRGVERKLEKASCSDFSPLFIRANVGVISNCSMMGEGEGHPALRMQQLRR